MSRGLESAVSRLDAEGIFVGLLDGQVAKLRTLDDAIDVGCSFVVCGQFAQKRIYGNEGLMLTPSPRHLGLDLPLKLE